MFRALTAIAASTIVALLTAPAHAQETRIEQLASGSVVVVFPDRTRVVLDEDAVSRLSQRFETTLLGAGAALGGDGGTSGGTSGGTDGAGNGTTAGVIAGLESDTSQYGIEEALALESQLNGIVADTIADGGIAGGGTDDGASLASADGNGGNGGDSVFNPVVDLTDPEAVGDEDIPASGAQ